MSGGNAGLRGHVCVGLAWLSLTLKGLVMSSSHRCGTATQCLEPGPLAFPQHKPLSAACARRARAVILERPSQPQAQKVALRRTELSFSWLYITQPPPKPRGKGQMDFPARRADPNANPNPSHCSLHTSLEERKKNGDIKRSFSTTADRPRGSARRPVGRVKKGSEELCL